MKQIKIRKTWGVMSPVTKRLDSKKVYRRRNKFNKWD